VSFQWKRAGSRKRNLSKLVDRKYDPVSRFIHLSLFLRISITSLIHLVLRSDLCPNTFTWSQSITWFSLVVWSVKDWDQVKVLGHKSDRKTRWIKKAIEIRKNKDKCMNRDTGSYFLSTSFDKFLFREPARFHGNDTSQRRVDSFSVLRKASDDAETSTLNYKRFEIVFNIFIMLNCIFDREEQLTIASSCEHMHVMTLCSMSLREPRCLGHSASTSSNNIKLGAFRHASANIRRSWSSDSPTYLRKQQTHFYLTGQVFPELFKVLP